MLGTNILYKAYAEYDSYKRCDRMGLHRASLKLNFAND